MKRFLPYAVLLAALVAAVYIRTNNLGAPYLTHWDESFHALVSKNMIAHPLVPTLIDDPAFPPESMQINPPWAMSHLWFHKGTLPAWLGALGLAVVGTDLGPLGFRCASLVMSLCSIVLIFFLGRHLFNERVGMIAAVLLAVNPMATAHVQGVYLADIVDSTLLAMALAGLFALVRAAETARPIPSALTGVFTAMAFMTKYYPGLIVPAVAFLLILFDRDARRNLLKLRSLAWSVGSVLAILGPWAAYYSYMYSYEFAGELLYYIRYISQSAENWGAPWDRYVFDYLPNAARDAFIPGVLAAAVFPFARATREQFSVKMIFFWFIAAAVPHTLSYTKAPNYALLPMPALILFAAVLADSAFREKFTSGLAAAAFGALIFIPAQISNILSPGRGPGSGSEYFGVGMHMTWIFQQGGVAIAAAVVLSLLARMASRNDIARYVLGNLFKGVCIVGLVFMVLRQTRDSWALTFRHDNPDVLLAVTDFAHTTPPRSVFFLAPNTVRHTGFMFYADRAAYMGEREKAEKVMNQIPLDRALYVISFEEGQNVLFKAPNGAIVYRLR